MQSPRTRLPRAVVALTIGTALTVATTFLAMPAAHAAGNQAVVVAGMDLNDGGNAVINDLETQQVAPGLLHVSYERLDPAGWQQIDVLKAELSDKTVKMKYLSPATVSGSGTTVTDLVEGNGAIAGVNLDRFDINNSYAASGWGVSGGKILKSGNGDAAASVGVDSSGLGTLVDLALAGALTLPDQSSVPIDGINVDYLVGDGVVLYNAHWGSYTRDRIFGRDTSIGAGVEVWIDAAGKVVKGPQPTAGDEGPIPEGQQILAAYNTKPGGAALSQLHVGDTVSVSYAIKDSVDVAEAGGAWHRLIRDGQAVPYPNEEYYTGVNPRTMIGFSKSRSTALFVVVDGRQGNAKGMAFNQQQELMGDLGAWDAINADGGGSSQLNVRHQGDTATTIENSPSDGYERSDGDGMGLVLAKPGSGQLLSFALATTLADEDSVRLFPGTTRTLTASGFDESGSAVSGLPSSWKSSDTKVAEVTGGTVRGLRSGTVQIRARNGVANGSVDLDVLGPLVQLAADQNVVNLEKQGSSQVLTFAGTDAQGFRAPVEAADLTIENSNPEVFSVEATEDGRVRVTATGEQGTALLAFTNSGHRAEVSVAVPLEVKTIDDFHDISGWTAANDRAPGCNIEPGEGHDGAPSIRLNYNFTNSQATRGCYAVAPGAVQGKYTGIDIPGRPQKLSVWIKGDTKGALLRLQVMQSNNVTNWIDGPGGSQSLHATWDGWQRVDFSVPSSFAFPLRFQRIRALETVAAKQYTGSLEFSQIFAYLPPESSVSPQQETVEDPILTATGSTDTAPLRVAVMSDAQFVAASPDSGAVAGARDALREIVAAKPDVLLIDGDFVDEASTADFALARSILDQELAGVDFPWYYVPGNHEIMGATIANFTAAFGQTWRSFDLKNTKFIGLDSSSGKLQTDFSQLKMLRAQLDDAAEDPAVTGVVVFTHMPIDDPLPTKGSQLTDRVEAAMLSDWFTEFRHNSGKSIAVVNGHVGVFHTSSTDGVPTIINGNSGKAPASTVADGGFTGWTMLGIDPTQGRWQTSDSPWLSDEVRTRVDELNVSLPSGVLKPGEQVTLNPVVLQDGDREVPVVWPVSHDWSGTAGVYVGDPADAPTSAVVAVDPDTGVLTALAKGTGTVTLAVNDARADIPFEVSEATATVTGTPITDGTLSVSVSGWPTQATYRYQWRRDASPIEGATAAQYRPVSGDVGHSIDVQVTVSGPELATVTAIAAPQAEVVQPGSQARFTAGLSGVARVGSTLSATGDWPKDAVLTFRWLRDGQPIHAAESSSYNITQSDLGHRLAVTVTSARMGYLDQSSTSPTSASVLVAEGGEPTPVPQTVKAGTVTIDGTARVGAKLTATTRGWGADARFLYQWLRDGKAIPGAQSRTYRPTSADLRRSVSVRVVGSAAQKVSVSRDSGNRTVAVGKLTSGTIRIAGTARPGHRLAASTTGFGKGVRVSYRWTSRGRLVGTGSTLLVRQSYRGSALQLRVKVTKPGYTSVEKTVRTRAVRS
jgi:3',5'-cyclic AMP phosphodiesterase CpdA